MFLISSFIIPPTKGSGNYSKFEIPLLALDLLEAYHEMYGI
jgi:hypothetical protein